MTAAAMVLLLVAPVVARAAAPRAASIFTDHMVLQQGMPVPVWGTADAGATVTVHFAGQAKATVADPAGNWAVKLDLLAASAEARAMQVVSTLSGREDRQTFRDVLVGEVWLCSGQSNMFFPVGKVDIYPGFRGAEQDIAASADALLRMNCDPEHPLWRGGDGAWSVSGPESVRRFSATAYYFGRTLRRELGVPVGLILRSRGGTHVHAWMPEEAAMSVPLVRHYRELFLANRDQIQTYNAAQRRYSQVLDAWKADHSKPRPDPPQPLSPELMTARRFHGVGVLFDRLIRPVIPYAIRGAIWYQGESDSDQPDMARAYAAQLTELIATWRRAWGQGDFPFYFVQLPCFTPGTNWPDVRQGMLEVFRSVPATGMAVMVDTGDVDNLHPDTKQEAGGRLANWALAKTYSRDVACAGPVFRDFVIDVQRLTIRFDPDGPGLVASGGALADFEVAGRDGRFVPATASIADGAVIVSAPAVASPLAVRYGWKPAFRPTLFGANGLPASPFAASHSKD